MTDRFVIAVAFPLHESDRAMMREQAKHPLPAIYPDSIAQPCATCQMVLAVGPRVAAAQRDNPQLTIICPRCLAKRLDRWQEFDILSFDNPDSKYEDA